MKEYIVVRFDNHHHLDEIIRTTDLDTATEELKYDFQRVLECKYGDSCIDVFCKCLKNIYSDNDEDFLLLDGIISEAACYNINSKYDYNWMIL